MGGSEGADGSFSIGSFDKGGETSPDGKGGWITQPHGLRKKVGIWKCYDRNGSLIRTVRYEDQANRRGWTDKTLGMIFL